MAWGHLAAVRSTGPSLPRDREPAVATLSSAASATRADLWQAGCSFLSRPADASAATASGGIETTTRRRPDMMFDPTYHGQPGLTQSPFTPHGFGGHFPGQLGQAIGWSSYPQLAGQFPPLGGQLGQGFGGYPPLGGQLGQLSPFGHVPYALPALAQLCGQLGQAAHAWPAPAQLGVSPWQIAQPGAFGGQLGQVGPMLVVVPTLVPPGVFGQFPGQIGLPPVPPFGWLGQSQLAGQIGAPAFAQGMLGGQQGAFGQRGFGAIGGPLSFQTTPQLAYAG
jgi:hypothetical protein